IEFPSRKVLHQLKVERIGQGTTGTINGVAPEGEIPTDYKAIVRYYLSHFIHSWKGAPIQGVGHRVVHGGSAYSQPVLIDDEVKAAIRKMIPLVPLHNPVNLQGIEVCEELLPEVH